MFIKEIRIKNFRSIGDIKINCDKFNIFVGQNNHGKSNIFEALDYFYTRSGVNDEIRNKNIANEDIMVSIAFGSVQAGIELMKNDKNKESLKKVFNECDIIRVERSSNDKERTIYIGEEKLEKNPAVDKALNDLLPKFQYVDARQHTEKLGGYKKSNEIGKLLATVIEQISQGDNEYQDFLNSFNKFFNGSFSKKIKNIEDGIKSYVAKQFPDCNGVIFNIKQPHFEHLIKDICIKINDGVETDVYEKGMGCKIIQQFKIVKSSTKGERPEFAKMVDFIKKQKEKIIILVYNTDRLQRDFDEQVLLLHKLVKEDRAEIHYTSTGQIINSNADSSAKFRHGLDVLLASDYANRISDNVKRSYVRKLQEGEVLGKAPVGYLNERTIDNKSSVIVDSIMSIFIQKLFEDYATGLYSLNSLVKKYKELGLRNNAKKNGIKTNKTLNSDRLQYVISEPFYYGMMDYKGILCPHKYERLITKELFDKCQDVMHRRSKVKSKVDIKKLFTFSGLIRCEKCSYLFSPELKTKKNSGQQFIYLTPNGMIKGKCDCQRVNEKLPLSILKEHISRLSVPQEVLEKIREKLNKKCNSNKDFNSKQVSRIRAELTIIQSRLEELMNRYLDKLITDDKFKKFKVKYEEERIKLESNLNSIYKEDSKLEISLDRLINLTPKIQTLFKSSKQDKKRAILKLLFSNFFLSGKTLVFTVVKPFDEVLKCGERPIWLPSFNIFRNKQDDILSTMNRPMMEGVRLCLAA